MSVPKGSQKVVYVGKTIDPGPALRNARSKYPPIQSGAHGHVIKNHPYEIEKDPEHPLRFYPAAWGGIFFHRVAEDEVKPL